MDFLILVVIIAVIGGAVYWFNTRQNEESDQPVQSRTSSYNQQSEYADLMKLKKSTIQLREHKKIEGTISSNSVTLISELSYSRDEFYGWIDIIDGYHDTPPTDRSYDKVKSWEYLGFADRNNASQRSKDFNDLVALFRKEVDAIIQEMTKDRWTSDLTLDDNGKRVFVLTRDSE